MSMQAVLLPLFVQVVVTLVVLYVLGARRFAAVRGGNVRGPVALREPNWPVQTRQAEYNYQNQFELPGFVSPIRSWTPASTIVKRA